MWRLCREDIYSSLSSAGAAFQLSWPWDFHSFFLSFSYFSSRFLHFLSFPSSSSSNMLGIFTASQRRERRELENHWVFSWIENIYEWARRRDHLPIFHILLFSSTPFPFSSSFHYQSQIVRITCFPFFTSSLSFFFVIEYFFFFSLFLFFLFFRMLSFLSSLFFSSQIFIEWSSFSFLNGIHSDGFDWLDS